MTKGIPLILTALCAALTIGRAEEGPLSPDPLKSESTGISVLAMYYSNYLWRGIEFYNKGGAVHRYAAQLGASLTP